MSSPKNRDKERLLGLLWEEFISKIDREWSFKYACLGETRAETSKLQDLAKRITSNVNESVNPPNPLSQSTFSAALKRKGWLIKTTKHELDVLAKYLGYQNWLDFKEKHPKVNGQKDPEDTHIQRDGSDWNFWGP